MSADDDVRTISIEAARRRKKQADAEAAAPSALWVDADDWREADITPRPWIAPGYALHGAVTILAGPPSAAKSSLLLAWCSAIALGRHHGDFEPRTAGKVVLYNVEDDSDEQRRRLSAALRQFNASPADVQGRIIRTGPAGIGTLLEVDPDTRLTTETAAMLALRSLLREHKPDVLIADPLAELHTSEENDNGAMRTVIAAFRALASEFNIAVIIVHHTRKGAATPGDPDAARGASSLIGAGRVVLTLNPMCEGDAEALGIATDRKTRSAYVRLDDAKQNYAAIGDARWFEKIVYTLENGEHVPAVVPWKAPDVWAAINTIVANRILDDIAAGPAPERHYTDANAASDRAAWPVVQKYVASLNEKQCRAVVAEWIKNGVLRRIKYDDPVERKERGGLAVGIRPGGVN